MNIESEFSKSADRLRGRKIVVTGASSGIGRMTAHLFAQAGASLALLDRSHPDTSSLASLPNVYRFEVDVTDDVNIERLIDEAAASMGGIDGVVNAAGIMSTGQIHDLSISAWRRVVEVNLFGTYAVTRSCLKWMASEKKGTIVNISSAAGLLSNTPGLTAYAASKGGVISFTRALAAEVAPKIRANTVCPGMVDTPMAEGFRANVGNYALKRLADPEEVANAILFLTSDESSYITGSALAVDGGRSFH